MSAEKIFFNIVILILVIFIFNRYLITQKTSLLVVLTGQFFSLILSLTTVFNNVKPNIIIEVVISLFGIILPSLIFFYFYFRNKELKIRKYFSNLLGMFKQKVTSEIDERFLLDDGSKDKLGLGQKVSLIAEEAVEELLRGYSCPAEDIPQSVKDGLNDVSRLINLKAWRKGVETYLKLEKQCGDNPVLQFNIGNLYFHLKEYHNAINRYNKAIAFNQIAKSANKVDEEENSRKTAARRIKTVLKKIEDYKIIYNSAVCTLNQGKYDKAIDMFKKAAESKDNWIDIYQPLAIIYESLDKSAEAAEMYENLAEIYPENFEIQRKAGDFLIKEGNVEKAKIFYERASILKKDFSKGYINIADYLLSKERYKEAIDLYKKAAEITSDISEIHYNLGNAYYGNVQKLQALSEYKKAIEINPNDFKSYYNLGVILDELEMKEEAVLAFEHALDIKPDFYDASNNLSVVLCSLGRYDYAIKNYIKALQYSPNNIELYFNLAITLEYMKKYGQAEELYQKIIKMNPKAFEAYYNLGLLRYQNEDFKGAEHFLRKAVDVNNEFHKAYYHLAKTYILSREYGRSIECLKKAVSMSNEYIDRARTEPIFEEIRNLKTFASIVNY